MILEAHRTGVVGALKGMAERPDMTGELARITVPSVVMVGMADNLLPREAVETLAQMLPKGWLVEIPDAGHMLMMEDPQAVAQALRELLSMVENTVA